MKLNEAYVVCEIAGEVFLMPVGNEVVNVGAMLSLNATSTFIVQALKEKELTKGELIELIYEEFEAEKEQIINDLDEFIQKGVEIGFLIN